MIIDLTSGIQDAKDSVYLMLCRQNMKVVDKHNGHNGGAQIIPLQFGKYNCPWL
jgi:hypothetical protein